MKIRDLFKNKRNYRYIPWGILFIFSLCVFFAWRPVNLGLRRIALRLKYHYNAAHFAARTGDLYELKLLSPDLLQTKDINGRSPVFDSDDIEILEFLLSQKVDPDSTDQQGISLLQFFCMRRRPDLATKLLEYNVDVNQYDSEGASALLWAIKRRYSDLVRLLLDRGALVGRTLNNGMSYIDFAMTRYDENSEIVKLLLERLELERQKIRAPGE